MTEIKLIPYKDYFICRKINKEKIDINEGGVFFEKNIMPIYEILRISSDIKNSEYKIGDYVIINSSGTHLTENGKDVFLISEKNVIGKLQNK